MANSGADPLELIVKLTAAAAAPDTTEHHSLQGRLTSLGLELTPLHPLTSDPELASYTVARVDPADAATVIEQLSGVDGVDGVYTKPRGEPPQGA
jgi:hypothetical protein